MIRTLTVVKYLYLVFQLITVLFVVGMAQADSPTEVEGATTIDVARAKAIFDRGVPLVDVGSRPLYDYGHIPRAVHLVTTGGFTEAQLREVATKDQEVVIYCDGVK